MICIYFKWKISESIDDNSGLSSSVSRHLRKCSDCREFYRNTLAMGRELERSKGAFGEFDSGAFAERTAEKIDFGKLPVQAKGRFYPYKAIAAGILLIGLMSTAVVLNTNDTKTTSLDDFKNLLPARSQELISNPQQIASLISDPYRREIDGLKKNAESAVKFAFSCTGLQAEKLGININFLAEKKEIPVTQ